MAINPDCWDNAANHSGKTGRRHYYGDLSAIPAVRVKLQTIFPSLNIEPRIDFRDPALPEGRYNVIYELVGERKFSGNSGKDRTIGLETEKLYRELNAIATRMGLVNPTEPPPPQKRAFFLKQKPGHANCSLYMCPIVAENDAFMAALATDSNLERQAKKVVDAIFVAYENAHERPR